MAKMVNEWQRVLDATLAWAEIEVGCRTRCIWRQDFVGACSDWWSLWWLVQNPEFGEGFQNSTKCLAQILVCSCLFRLIWKESDFGHQQYLHSLDPPIRVSFPTSPGCLVQRNRLHPLLAIQKGDRIVAVRSLEKARAARDFEDWRQR